MHTFNRDYAVYPPLSGAGAPGNRIAQRLQSAGTAVVSSKLSKGRVYHIVTGAVALRVTFYADGTLTPGSAVSNSTSFRIPPNTVFPFLAFEGEKDGNDVPRFGSTYVYAVGDAGAAFEAFLYEAGL